MIKDNWYKVFFQIAFLICCCTNNIQAHPGGHYHKGDGIILNSWQLKNGHSVLGNFSMGKDDYIVLEQEDGKLLKLPLTDLSDQDQLLAKYKIKKFERTNEQQIAKTAAPENNTTGNMYLFLSLFFAISVVTLLSYSVITIINTTNSKRKKYQLAYLIPVMGIMIFACKKSADQVATTVVPKTSTSFIDSAFSPFKPAVQTSWDANYFHVSSAGLPNHNMMIGITSWQQQVPIPQFYTGSNSWSIPLQPEYAATPLSTKTNLMKGAVAIAVNGIPIFNALNNRGVDSYATGELDNWGGHCGRADDYHYHAAPMHLSALSGLQPIAFALDGFAVYGSKEPDGSVMQSLDTCHGHIGANGVYHYHGTTTYPYVIGAMKGKVNLDPATPAPENQILPQAFASPLRPSTNPLTGAIITNFISTGTYAYKLTYTIGTQFGYVEYFWDNANKYTYKLTDINGNVTTNVYQR